MSWSGGLTLRVSIPSPCRSLNFSRQALDSGIWGLEPGSWTPQGLGTVGRLEFGEKIRPGGGTKALWGPGCWSQAAWAGGWEWGSGGDCQVGEESR